MFNDPQQLRTLLIAGATFGLVVSAWIAIVMVWTRRRRTRAKVIEQRIGLIDPGGGTGEPRVLRLWRDGTEATAVVPGMRRTSWSQRLDGLCQDAGWTTTGAQAAWRVGGAAVVVFLLAWVISGSLLGAVGGGAAVVIVFWIYLQQRIARRSALFDRQLADALDLAVRSLRVGHPLGGAFQLISQEMPAPVGPIFAEVCQQESLGVPLSEALRQAAAVHTSEDLKLFATAVIIQLRSGGSLAEMMERVAFVIRDRIRLTQRVRVLTSQTQLSKRVLQALPVFVFVLLNVVNPAYMRPLYTTESGRLVLIVAVALMMVGSWLMNRMAVIRY